MNELPPNWLHQTLESTKAINEENRFGFTDEEIEQNVAAYRAWLKFEPIQFWQSMGFQPGWIDSLHNGNRSESVHEAFHLGTLRRPKP